MRLGLKQSQIIRARRVWSSLTALVETVMIEQKVDIWTVQETDPNAWICITTNGELRQDGACVMGRGTAYQAAKRYPQLPYQVGNHIRANGNHVGVFSPYKLFTFPVKKYWREKARISLIRQSCKELQEARTNLVNIKRIYLPRPGCGNGQLLWDQVRLVLVNELLGDDFVVVWQ
jgi:hypothetical protein